MADPSRERGIVRPLEPWLSYAGTPIEYTPVPDDFEVNGIVASDNGRYLVVVQTNTGKLFRLEIATKEVVEIDVGGASVNGDGLQLLGRKLYAVADGGIVEVLLSGDLSRGEVVSRTTDPSFSSPTTNAIAWAACSSSTRSSTASSAASLPCCRSRSRASRFRSARRRAGPEWPGPPPQPARSPRTCERSAP